MESGGKMKWKLAVNANWIRDRDSGSTRATLRSEAGQPRPSGRGRGSCGAGGVLGVVFRQELVLALLAREQEEDEGRADKDQDEACRIGPVVAREGRQRRAA